jgi:butyrate kinase
MSGVLRVLAVNPGGMTTKIAVYEDDTRVYEATVDHSRGELSGFDTIPDQLDYRKTAIEAALKSGGYRGKSFDAVVGRGGLFKSIPSGTYFVNEEMLHDARTGYAGQHASNLGALLAEALRRDLGGKAFVVDPVCVDEFESLARYSGHPEIKRKSLLHALNIKATAKKAAAKLGSRIDDVNMIVAHLGSGISIAPLRKGKMVDVNNALSGGPFSPERTGALPLIEMFDFMIEKRYDPGRMKKFIAKEGGLLAYLGTNDFREIEKRVEGGDPDARETVEAMAYQTGKEICAMAAVLSGDVDAIVLTGALANSGLLVDLLKKRVSFVADVLVLPGENELESLAGGALEVLRGEADPKVYPTGRAATGKGNVCR